MGSSARAHLAYGYYLGTGEDFLATQRDEHGMADVPWFDEDSSDYEFSEQAEKALLNAAGFTETDWRAEGYYDRKKVAEETIGVELRESGHSDYPGWLLIARDTDRNVEWADAMVLDRDEIVALRPEWDTKLANALDALGIIPTQDGPKWLVYPTYG